MSVPGRRKGPINTRTPIAKNSWQRLPFIIQYQCLNISHRYWNTSFFLSESSLSVFLSYSPLYTSQLLKDISQRQKDSRQQKQVDLRRAYITARFTPATLPAFFTLGDQLDYGGFENRALDPGQEYVFFILAELNSTTGVQKATMSHLLSFCVYNHSLIPRCLSLSPAGCHHTLQSIWPCC